MNDCNVYFIYVFAASIFKYYTKLWKCYDSVRIDDEEKRIPVLRLMNEENMCER